MPEGPSILHLRDKLSPFIGKIVKDAGGYGPMETDWLLKKKLLDICTWGKHLLFLFKDGTVKVHLMLFGEIVVNERKKVNPSFFMHFANGEINGYVIKAEKLDQPPEQIYDWRTDILHKDFSAAYIKQKLKLLGSKTIDDVLMDQNVFTGVGNKIRNEALYRAGIHPLSIVGKIPAPKVSKLIKEVVAYAKIFYAQLTTTGENKSFSVYQQEYAADGSTVTMTVLKKSKRKIFFSEHKQQLYN